MNKSLLLLLRYRYFFVLSVLCTSLFLYPPQLRGLKVNNERGNTFILSSFSFFFFPDALSVVAETDCWHESRSLDPFGTLGRRDNALS